MKKFVVFLAFSALSELSIADVKTNYVYVVSNIYNQVFTETVVTQKVKNTHTNYYITNNVTTVNKIYNTTFKTNMSVNCDVSQAFVIAASNEANRASGFVANASSFADSAAESATTAGGYASSAESSASLASYQRQQAATECDQALSNINARINWFDQHSGETITQVNIVTNINATIYNTIDNTIEQTVVNNTFDDVPYNPDSHLKVNLNDFAMMAKGGTNSTYTISAPSGCLNDSGYTIGIGSFTMRFKKFELANDGTGKFWYSSTYDTGTPYQGSGHTWRFEWAYWHNGVWHVAIRQRRFVSGEVTEDQVFDMTLSSVYPGSSTGTFSNRPSSTWSPSNSSFGKLTGRTYSDAFSYVARMAIRDQVIDEANAARDSAKAYADELAALLGARVDALDTRLTNADNGYPHAYVSPGGTTYPNVIYYDRATDDGKIAVTTVGNYHPSTQYRIVPNFGGSAAANYWIFEPAYVDTDVNGLRIHYLPTQAKTITATTYNAGYKYVPRDFYWQNGVVYFVMDSYNGTTWSGRVRMKYAGNNENAWPNGVLNESAGGALNTTHYRTMTFDYREGTIMGTSTSFIPGYFKTEYNKIMPYYDSVLWIPATYSTEQKTIVDWLSTFIR